MAKYEISGDYARYLSLKQNLVKRFRYLWTFELINALIIFPSFLLIMGQNIHIENATVVITVAFCIMLIIGSAFCFLKYRDLKNGTHYIISYESIFKALRWILPPLLFLVLIIYLQSDFIATEDWFLAILMYTMAILEYINYFHLQLMYDNKQDIEYLMKYKRLKQGLIAREFSW